MESVPRCVVLSVGGVRGGGGGEAEAGIPTYLRIYIFLGFCHLLDFVLKRNGTTNFNRL